MANQYTPISDDQAEFDQFNAKLDSSIDTSNRILDQVDMESKHSDQLVGEMGTMKRFMQATTHSLSESAKTIAMSTKQLASDLTDSIDKPSYMQRLVTIAGGPFAKIAVDAVAKTGIVQKMGDSVKESMSNGLSMLRNRSLRRKEIMPGGDDGGFKQVDSITTKMSGPLTAGNEIAKEQLDESKKQTRLLGSSLTDIPKTVQHDNPKTDINLVRKIDDIEHEVKDTSLRTTDQLTRKIVDVDKSIKSSNNAAYSIRILQASEATSSKMDSLINLQETFLEKLDVLTSAFNDPESKKSSLFTSIASAATDMFITGGKLNALKKGLYTNDIAKSPNPLVTIASGIQEIYRWQRLYGELTKRQINELIRLGGGTQQEVVGKRGVFFDWLIKQKYSMMKRLMKMAESGGLIGAAGKLIKTATDYGFISADDSEESKHASANIFMDQIFKKGKGVKEANRASSLNPQHGSRYMGSLGISDDTNPDAGMDSLYAKQKEEFEKSNKAVKDPELQQVLDAYNKKIQTLISTVAPTDPKQLKKFQRNQKKQLSSLSEKAQIEIADYYESRGMDPTSERFALTGDMIQHVGSSSASQISREGKDDAHYEQSIVKKAKKANSRLHNDKWRSDTVQEIEDDLKKKGLDKKYTVKLVNDKVSIEQIMANGKINRIADGVVKGPKKIETARGENIITSANDTLLAVKDGTLKKILSIFDFLRSFISKFDTNKFSPAKMVPASANMAQPIMQKAGTPKEKDNTISHLNQTVEKIGEKVSGMHGMAKEAKDARIKDKKDAFWANLKGGAKKGFGAIGSLFSSLGKLGMGNIAALLVFVFMLMKFPKATMGFLGWTFDSPMNFVKAWVMKNKLVKVFTTSGGAIAKFSWKAFKFAVNASLHPLKFLSDITSQISKVYAIFTKGGFINTLKYLATRISGSRSLITKMPAIIKNILHPIQYLKTIWTALSAVFKGVKSIGGVAKAGSSLFKIAGKTGGKILGKQVPGLGAIIGVLFGIMRFKKGQIIRGLLEIVSGLLTIVPTGIGNIISLVIDGILVLSDIKLKKKDLVSKNTTTSKAKEGKSFWRNVPGIGTVMRMMDGFKLWNSGKHAAGALEILKGIAVTVPGVGFIIAAMESLQGMSFKDMAIKSFNNMIAIPKWMVKTGYNIAKAVIKAIVAIPVWIAKTVFNNIKNSLKVMFVTFPKWLLKNWAQGMKITITLIVGIPLFIAKHVIKSVISVMKFSWITFPKWVVKTASNLIKGIVNTILSIPKLIMRGVVNTLIFAFKSGKWVMDTSKKIIKNIVRTVISIPKFIITTSINAIVAIITAPWKIQKSLVGLGKKWIKTGFSVIKNFFLEIVQSIKDFVNNPIKWFKNLMANKEENVADPITTKATVRSKEKKASDPIKSKITEKSNRNVAISDSEKRRQEHRDAAIKAMRSERSELESLAKKAGLQPSSRINATKEGGVYTSVESGGKRVDLVEAGLLSKAQLKKVEDVRHMRRIMNGDPEPIMNSTTKSKLKVLEQNKTRNDVKAATKANVGIKNAVEDTSKKTNNAIMQSSNKIVSNRSTSQNTTINNTQTDPFYIKASGIDPAFLFA